MEGDDHIVIFWLIEPVASFWDSQRFLSKPLIPSLESFSTEPIQGLKTIKKPH
jgi:hypothetical protein